MNKRNLRLTYGKRFAAWRRLGLRKIPVGASAFVVFCSATFLLLRGTLRVPFIATAKTSFTFTRCPVRRNDLAGSHL
jgi:hypothetical protein